MKATECGKGGIHRGQPRSPGQSEKATTANRPAQVSEDHQDPGKVNSHGLLCSFFLGGGDQGATTEQPQVSVFQQLLTSTTC